MTTARRSRAAAIAAAAVLVVLAARTLRPEVFLAAVVLLLAFGGWVMLALEAFGGLLWPLLRRTVIAAGWPRASYFLSYAARPTWEKDRGGGAALAGALALLHRPAHDPTLAAWVEQRIEVDRGYAGVVASALLAAGRGDRDGARDLLHSAEDFDPDFAPKAARQVASEWLVADAAERGDWTAVIRRGCDPGRATAYTRFLARAAARVRGEAPPSEPSPTDLGLRVSWLLTPRRAALRPLLERALRSPRVLHQRKPPPPPPPPPPAPTIDPAAYADDPVALALALHALWTHEPQLAGRLTIARLHELCSAWDQAWRPATRRMAERSLALGSQVKGEEAVEAARQAVGADLAALARRAGLPLAALAGAGETAAAAALRMRAGLLGEVEEASEELRQRTKSDRRLPAAEELRAWNQLRRLYEEAALLGGMELRHLLFPTIHRDACNYAVWLWNDRKEYGISGPIFKWLLAEAEAVGDQEAIELQRKNVGVKK